MPAKQSKKQIFKRFQKKHGDKYDYSLIGDITNMATKVPIKCIKHDIIFHNTPNSHIYGGGCAKCGRENQSKKVIALKKNQFKEKAHKKHNKKYTYNNTDYVGHNRKIVITCPEHGDFEQMAKGHLEGQGCPKCIIYGYKKGDFLKRCKNNRALLYVIECYNEEEEFIKIGITSKEYTPDRFNGNMKMPYHYIVLCEKRDSPEVIYNFEKYLHKKFKHLKYKPKIKFSGDSECFKI